MKFSKKATSIAEALIVTVIVATGLVGVYNIYNQSNKLSSGVKNKIQAIQIAREGIEAVSNIRDTNWLIFSKLNYEKCWNTFNYDNGCISPITPTDTSFMIEGNVNYKIYKNSNNRWELEKPAIILTGTGYTDSDYRNYYKIILDDKGLYTQTGSIGINNHSELRPIYTREITFKYTEANYQKMIVTSKVTWSDNTKSTPRNIELETELTNWKLKKD